MKKRFTEWIEAWDWQGRNRKENSNTYKDLEATSRIKVTLKEPDDWSSYIIPVQEKGRYMLWIRYKSIKGALVNFHFDNKILSFGTKFAPAKQKYCWIRLGEESLKKIEKGVHIFKIELISGSLDLDSILFTNDLALTPRGKKRYIDQEILNERERLIKEIKEKIAKHRKIKVATVQYAACAALGPQQRRNMRRDEYRLLKIGAIIDEAAKQGADIICFPECITEPGKGGAKRGEKWGESETIPGGWSVEYIRKKAKENKIYVVSWTSEKDGKIEYNTAYIVNRKGEISGKYRKVHTFGAPWKAGNCFPVFETDFGKIGILICYDNQFPEAARILSLKGAEIIFYLLAGDERGNAEWEMMTRARAIDNNVYLVASPFAEVAGLIIDLDGSVIARTDISGNDIASSKDRDKYIIEHKNSLKGKGVVVAEIDLDKIKGHSGINNRKGYNITDRRPEVYKELVAPLHVRRSLPVELDRDMYIT